MEEDKYTSLTSIRARKLELEKSIDKSGDEISRQWKDLFHAKEVPAYSPTQRLLSVASSSVGIIDGIFFGWKILRKFKKKR